MMFRLLCFLFFLKVGAFYPNDPLVQPIEDDSTSFSSHHNKIPWFLGEYGINILEAWDYKREANDILIAIIDSGFNYKHPDLEGVLDFGPYIKSKRWSLEEVKRNMMINPGHGTSVLGVMAAKGNNGIGTTGINQNARVLAIPHSSGLTMRDSRPSLMTTAEAIRFAVDSGAKVINASWGGENTTDLYQAVKYAKEKGVIIVAAASNYGVDIFESLQEYLLFPAAYSAIWENVITVGQHYIDYENEPKINEREVLSSYSRISVDVFAPGSYIPVLKAYDDDYSLDRSGGTSLAAPLVTGVISLMLSLNPELSPKDIKNILIDTSRRTMIGKELKLSSRSEGVVDAKKALEVVQKIKRGSFMISPQKVILAKNQSFPISIFSKNKNLKLKVSDSKVADIDDNLNITGLSEGKATIEFYNQQENKTIIVNVEVL